MAVQSCQPNENDWVYVNHQLLRVYIKWARGPADVPIPGEISNTKRRKCGSNSNNVPSQAAIGRDSRKSNPFTGMSRGRVEFNTLNQVVKSIQSYGKFNPRLEATEFIISEEDFEKLKELLEEEPDEPSPSPKDEPGQPQGPSIVSKADVQPTVSVLLKRFVETMRRRFATVNLPLPRDDGKHVIQFERMNFNLPVLVLKEESASVIQDAMLARHTQAVRLERKGESQWGIEELTAEMILEPGRRVLLVGDPGCGKSTLQRWIAYYSSSQWVADATKSMPLLLECNRFVAESTPTDLRSIIEIAVSRLCLNQTIQSFGLPRRTKELARVDQDNRVPTDFDRLCDEFEAAALNGRVVLLLDGIDEIPEKPRKLFCQTQLLDMVAVYPDLRLLVTSRPYGVDQVQHNMSAAFDIRIVAPFPKPTKEMFLDKLCAAVGNENAADVRRHVLERNANIAALSDTVLMLALGAQIYWNEPNRFPNSRCQLIEEAIKQMISRKEDLQDAPVTFNELVPHLEYLAFRMREAHQGLILRDQAAAQIENFRKKTKGRIIAIRSEADLLAAALHPVGILALAGQRLDDTGMYQDELKFVHPIFQEYLAGRCIRYDRSGMDELSRLKELIDNLGIAQRSVKERYRMKQEAVVAGDWQETIRLCIAQLPENVADSVFSHLLCQEDSDRKRALAVFAMLCLADEPRLGPETLTKIFEDFVSCMSEIDAAVSAARTAWDEALRVVGASSFGDKLRQYLLAAFFAADGVLRQFIGRACISEFSKYAINISPDNCEQAISDLLCGLEMDEMKNRAIATMVFLERCFISKDKLGFLTSEQRTRVIDALLTAAETEIDLRDLYLWALCWFTGAPSDGMRGHVEKFVTLDATSIGRIRAIMTDSRKNDLGFAGLLATMDENVVHINLGSDWLNEAALVAVGVKPRRNLLVPQPKGDAEIIRLLNERLKRSIDNNEEEVRTAIALARLGFKDHTVVAVLGEAFSKLSQERDEICVHLGLLGSQDAQAYLLGVLENPTVEEPYKDLGVLGLLLADDVEVLEQQMLRANRYCEIFAYGIAGSRSREEGLRVLLRHAKHDNPTISTAVGFAIKRRRTWDEEEAHRK